jgi:hypothetical protein
MSDLILIMILMTLTVCCSTIDRTIEYYYNCKLQKKVLVHFLLVVLFAIDAAYAPAPMPLSMFTTAKPRVQL